MSDDIDLGEYLRLVREHWVYAALGFAVVLGLVLLYTFYSAPVYEATSLVLVTSQDQASFLLGASAPKPADLETQKIIIQSPPVIYPIYQKYGDKGFTMTLSTLRNSNVIEIEVETDGAEKAAIIANEIAESYQNHAAKSRREDAEQIIQFVDGQIRGYEQEIDTLGMSLLLYKNMSNLTRNDENNVQVLQRQITAKNKIYDYLLSKREEAALQASLDSGNVKIVGYAEVPERPVRPNVMLNIVLGLMLAALGAVGAAWARDRF